jgi:hypothetical protein
MQDDFEPQDDSNPIHVICGPLFVPVLLPCGFELLESHHSGRAVRLGMINGCTDVWKRVLALASGGCTILGRYERRHLLGDNDVALAGHRGRAIEVDVSVTAKFRYPGLRFGEPIADGLQCKRFWSVWVSAERELGI